METLKKTAFKNKDNQERYKLWLDDFSKKISNRKQAQELCQANSISALINFKDYYLPDYPCYGSDFLFDVFKGKKKV